MPPALSSFCFCFTLQVGLVILASVFFTVSGIILAANLFDWHDSIGVVFMLLLVLMFLTAGVLMAVSTNNYNKPVALLAFFIIILVTCYWIILCILPFVDGESFVSMVCIGKRCPESFWIASLSYRRQLVEDIEVESVMQNYSTTTTSSTEWEWELEPGPNKNFTDKNETVNSKYSNNELIEARSNVGLHSKYRPSHGHFGKNDLIFDAEKDFPNGSEKMYYTFKNNFKNNLYNIPFSKNESEILVTNKKNTFPPRIDMNLLHGNNSSNHTEDKNEEPDIIIVGESLIGAVLLMVVNFLFLVFSAVVLYSWVVQINSLRDSSI